MRTTAVLRASGFRAAGLRAAGLVLVGAALSYFSLNWKFQGEEYLEERAADELDPMTQLAQSYLASAPPSIALEHLESAWALASQKQVGRGASMLIQVIAGRIYVDRSLTSSDYAWDQLRALFLLEQLRLILKAHSLPDLEFILVRECKWGFVC